MKLKWITAFTTEQNIGSVRLLEKSGFQLSASEDNNTIEHVSGMLTFILHNRQYQKVENQMSNDERK